MSDFWTLQQELYQPVYGSCGSLLVRPRAIRADTAIAEAQGCTQALIECDCVPWVDR